MKVIFATCVLLLLWQEKDLESTVLKQNTYDVKHTFPYLLNNALRSVALVVVDRELTHKLRLPAVKYNLILKKSNLYAYLYFNNYKSHQYYYMLETTVSTITNSFKISF
jgi:hypothetical protein